MMVSMRYLVLLFVLFAASPAAADPWRRWMMDWPATDFSRYAVPLGEIRPAGTGRDGIPSIDSPRFAAAAEARVPPQEPVLSVVIGGDARAYPLRILIWHEVVNDVVGGVPIAVTFGPLCHAALVYDRRVGTHTLEFGLTGLLRKSDFIMYDRQTESWWQHYEGRAIVGELTGAGLVPLPARLEAMERFLDRHPQGLIMIPTDDALRPYGRNPYTGYDTMPSPFHYNGPFPDDAAPMERVVVADGKAWSLGLLRARGRIEAGNLVIEWTPGQSSALDAKHIADGRDVGNVVVRRHDGAHLIDALYSVEFAFAFKAFNPDGTIIRD